MLLHATLRNHEVNMVSSPSILKSMPLDKMWASRYFPKPGYSYIWVTDMTLWFALLTTIKLAFSECCKFQVFSGL